LTVLFLVRLVLYVRIRLSGQERSQDLQDIL